MPRVENTLMPLSRTEQELREVAAIMQRRFTRLTNAFSKKWENHWAAVACWFAFYNFCRVHKSLRVTPAMAAGIADHVWSVRELLES